MRNLQTMRFTIINLILVLAVGAKIFAAGGDLDTTFTTGVAGFGSTANVVAVQPDGRVLVGGTFTVVNGRSYNRLARLNADGTIDQSFDIGAGFGNSVNAIAVQPDGRILVGGNFVNFNGRSYLAQLNADGSFDATFNMSGAGPNNQITVITLQANGQIIIGGGFSQYNGATANRLARLNADGTLDAPFATNLGTGFNNLVNVAELEADGQIVVGGSFTSANGTTANRIVRLNANGTLDTAFIANTGTGFNQIVNAVAVQTDGRILAGGNFATFNGTARDSIARLNADGTLDTNWTVIQSSGVTAIAIQPDGQFFVAGENSATFGTGASLRRSIARLNQSDGSIDLSFNAGTGADGVFLGSIALQLDGTIFVAGNFTNINGAPRSALAKLNTDGSVDANFTTVIGAGAQVDVIHVLPDDRILIGGSFRGVNESFRSAVARLHADGSVDRNFVPAADASVFFNGSVSAIAVQTNGRILIGGSFNNFGGDLNKDFIARLNADGSLDTTFNARTNGTVNAVVVQSDGRILIGGNFNSVNNVTAFGRIARLNADGTTDTTFNNGGAGFNSNVEDVVLQSNGEILVGGLFTSYNGTTGVNRIARLNSDGTLDAVFTTNTGAGFDAQVNTLAVQTDGRILVGGFFTVFDGAGSNRIVRLNANGTRDTNFNLGTGFGNLVNDFSLQPDGRILAGGNFTTYNGVTRRHLARLNADGSLDASFRSGVTLNNQLEAVGLQSDGRIIIGGALQSYDGISRFGIARVTAGDTLVWTGAADTNWNNGANWSTGFAPTATDNAIIQNNFNVNLSGGNSSVLTLTVGTNSTLTIAAGSSLTIEGGTNNGAIAGAGTLNFTGTALGNNGTISAAVVNANLGTSSSKALNGAGAFVGNVLTIASGVTLALQNNHQFNEINIQTNASFNATSRTVSLRGVNVLQGLGAIITTFGTIVFDGSTAQTVSRSIGFNNLTINNAAGVTFGGSANYSVAGTLALSNGILNITGSVPLTFDNNATAVQTNGYITGAVRKNFNAPSLPAFTFPIGTANGYSPITVAITSGTTQVTASVTQSNQPALNPATSLRRYWTLTASGGAFTANLNFNYLQSDVFGNESNYRITRVSGGVPQMFVNNCAAGSPCVNTTANTATVNGVQQFSDWTLGELAPTAAGVTVAGRVTNSNGKGIFGAHVSMIDENGNARNAMTNFYGYYRFTEIRAGQTYIVSARSKWHQFSQPIQVLFVNEDLTNVNFVASP